MISAERAKALASDRLNTMTPGGEQRDIGLYEFDEGYVAWRKQPTPEDPTALPDMVGGSCVVVDKQTGQVHVRPLLDPESVAEHYRRDKIAGRT